MTNPNKLLLDYANRHHLAELEDVPPAEYWPLPSSLFVTATAHDTVSAHGLVGIREVLIARRILPVALQSGREKRFELMLAATPLPRTDLADDTLAFYVPDTPPQILEMANQVRHEWNQLPIDTDYQQLRRGANEVTQRMVRYLTEHRLPFGLELAQGYLQLFSFNPKITETELELMVQSLLSLPVQ